MSFHLKNPKTGEEITVDSDTLSLEGYVRYLLAQGYNVPAEYCVDLAATSDDGSEATEKPPPPPDRAVEYTPGGTPIYGSVNVAQNAIRVMFEEKMAQAKREQPALFKKEELENVPGPAVRARDAKWVPPHRRETYMENAWSRNKIKAGKAVVDKRLNLSAIVRDRSVQERFNLTDYQLTHIRILMQTSMEKAAIKASECLHDNGFRIVVNADLTSVSRAAARTALMHAANEVGPAIRAREIPMIYLPGSTLLSMMPRTDSIHPDDLYTWEITGPGREFNTLAAVWVLVQQYGPHETAARFGSEYGFLRIMITTIERKTDCAETLTPGHEYHSGRRSDAWASLTKDLTSSLGEVADIDFGCLPLTVRDTAVATAPIVQGDWALVPYHVLKTPSGKIGSELLDKADVKRLGKDLFAVGLKPGRTHLSAHMRAPTDREEVRLRITDSDSDSVPSRVAVSAKGVLETRGVLCDVKGINASPGASGSIYVAETDGAVVGLHDGSGPNGMRMIPLPPDTLAVLASPVCWYAGGGPTRTRVLSPTIRTWSRNKQLRAHWSEFVQRLGVYHGGMTIQDGSVLRAAMPLTDGLRADGWRIAHTVSTPLSRVYRIERDLRDTVPAVLSRSGHDGEAVVVVCFDDNGIYVSSETPLGTECEFGSSNQVWTSLLCRGALLVAVKDQAVVGCMTPIDYTSGWVTYRVDGLPSLDPESSDVSRGGVFGPDQLANRDWLTRSFPFLNVQTYRTEVVDECFTHSSCGAYLHSRCVFSGYQNLARIGDAIMKARFHALLRERGVDPQQTTRIVAQWQSNEVQAVITDQIGLTDQLRRATRLTTLGRHGLADALEALVALVYFHEDETTLDKFLRSIVMFGEN